MANLSNRRAEPEARPQETTPCCGDKGRKMWLKVWMVTEPDGPIPTAGATPIGEFVACSNCKAPVTGLNVFDGFSAIDSALWLAMVARAKTHGPSAYFCELCDDGAMVVYDWSKNKMVKRLQSARDQISAVAKSTVLPFKKPFQQAKNEALMKAHQAASNAYQPEPPAEEWDAMEPL